MKKPYVINLMVALVLIAAGLFSYFSNQERPPTALIAPGVGVLLLLMTAALKKENKTVAHIVVVLTLLFGLISINMAVKSRKEPDEEKRERKLAVFSVMSVACFAATGLYVMGFIEKKKARRAKMESDKPENRT